jgi:hypothetical protein
MYREERDLGDRADARCEQQQRDQAEPVDRCRERQRGAHADRARDERARVGRLQRAGGQAGEHGQHERRAEQVAVDQEAVLDDVQRRLRPDERLVAEVAAAQLALQEHGREVVAQLVEQVQRRRVVALDQREHHKAQRRDQHQREQQQCEAPRDERRKRRGPCHRGQASRSSEGGRFR